MNVFEEASPGRKRLEAAVLGIAILLPILAHGQSGDRSGEEVVRAQCSKCHETGKGGAPKIGDRSAWIPRMKQGLDALVRSAIRGHGGMPARGGMADLTDAEVRAAIVYMFNKGAGSKS